MAKRSYFHFRITPDERERWQKFADEQFDGAIAPLIRAAVTGYINDTKSLHDNTEVLDKLLIVDKRLAEILSTLEGKEIIGIKAELIPGVLGEDPDPEITELIDEDIIYKEVDKSHGKYDF